MLIYFVDILLYQKKFIVFLLLNFLFVRKKVYLFPVEVVTNDHKLGRLKQYLLLSYSFGGQKSKKSISLGVGRAASF